MATPRKAAMPAERGTAPPPTTGSTAQPSSTSSSSTASGSDGDKGNSVQVVVRCRPPSEKEKANNDLMVVGTYPQHNEIRVVNKKTAASAGSIGSANGGGASGVSKADSKVYTFDATYGALSTQEEVYNNTVKPLVEEVLGGYNCCVFAYGQTGTGKTYSMEGELSASVTPHSGVIPRAVHTIFEQLAERNLEDYSVKVSFLELYNEELADLLCEQDDKVPSSSSMGGGSSSSGTAGANGSKDDERKELRIFEDPTGKKGMQVQNLEECLVASAPQVFALLTKANKRRRVAETNLNARSSRSHYVFTITVHSKTMEDGEDIIKTGKLYLVDLAGSECIGKSGATEKRAKEAGKINQSLLTLGRVINALVDRASFVPYRDSKLTRLLQESLGGRAKTCIIATVSPSHAAFDETLSTLDYAHRAKSIKNKENKTMSKRAYMKELLAEIASLKRDNEVLRSKNGIIIAPEKYERMLAEEKGKGMQIDELLFKINTQQAAMDQLQANLTQKETALTQALEEKDALTLSLADTVALLDSTRALLATSQEQLLASQKLLIDFQRRLYQREIELENSGALVDAQRATEYRLTSQTLQVLSALENTLTAKSALHEKIERKGAVEAHNASATASFHSRVGADLTALHEGESQLQQDAAAQIDALQARIGEITAERSASAATLRSTQTAFDASVAEQTTQLSAAVGAFQQTHAGTLAANAARVEQFHQARAAQLASVQQSGDDFFMSIGADAREIQQLSTAAHALSMQNARAVSESSVSFVRSEVLPKLQGLEHASTAHSSAAVSAQSACSEVMAAFQQVQTARVTRDAQTLQERIAAMQATNTARVAEMAAANTAKVQQLTQASAQRVQELTQANAAKVQELARLNAERMAKMQQEQGELVDRLQSELVESSARMQSELMSTTSAMQSSLLASVTDMQTAFLSEVDAMIAAHRSEQVATLQANVSDVTKRVEAMSAAESVAIAQLQSAVASMAQGATSFETASTARMEADIATAVESQSALVAKQEALTLRVAESQSSLHSAIDACTAENEARRVNAAKETAALAASTASFAAAQTSAIEKAAQSCVSHGASVSEWIVSVESSDAAASSQLRSSVTALSDLVEAHVSATDSSLRATTAHIESYVRGDLRRDVPLGSTPQKGAPAPVYPVQAELAKTASPNTVVASYRQVHPMKPLLFQGILKMDGLEELPTAAEAAAAMEAAALELDDVIVDTASPTSASSSNSTSTSASSSPVASVPTVSLSLQPLPALPRPSGALSAALAVPLPPDSASFDADHCGENVKPLSPTTAINASSGVEKAAKRPPSGPTGKLAAAAAAAAASQAASAAAAKPLATRSSSRLRYGTLPTVHGFAGEGKQ